MGKLILIFLSALIAPFTAPHGLNSATTTHEIYWRQLKVGEFANARGGRFASEPAQLTIEKLEAGRVGCKGAPLAKAKLQLSSGTSIYWRQLKVGEFANARGGRFASEPAQLTIEKLEAGRVGCKDAPLAKAKLQLSSGTSIYIVENIDEGRVLKLSNGALYEVDPDDIDISSAWLLPFPIRITDSDDPDYPLYLINNNTGTRVKVRLQND